MVDLHLDRRWGRVMLALATAVAALVLRLATATLLKDQLPFATFFLAMAVTSYLAGPVPAVLTAALGAIGSWWLFLPPIQSESTVFALVGYAGGCVAIIALGGAASRARARALRSARQAAEAAERLDRAQRAGRVGTFEFELATNTARSWGMEVVHGVSHPLDEPHDVWIRRVHPDDRPRIQAALADVLTAGKREYEDQYRVIGDDGAVRWIAARGEVRTNAHGRPVLVGVTIDVTDRVLADDALRQSEEKYRSLFENSLDAILLTRLDGRITDVNPAACALWGRSRAELVGADRAALVDQTPELLAVLEERKRTDSARGELDVRRPDGSRVTADVTSSLLGRGTANEHALVIARDITDRKRAIEADRRARQRIMEVIESISDGFLAVDREWRFVFINSRAANNGGEGRSPEALIGKNLWECFPSIRGTTLEVAYRKTMTERVPVYIEHGSPSRQAWYSTSVYPSSDGVALFWRDITERKQIEQALEEANSRLVEVDRRKNEFIGVLSHELRNPLAPIRNSLYILDHVPPGSEQARRALGVIDRQVTHLVQLVDDLLDVTRIVRGKVRLKRARVDLAEIVRRTVDDHRAAFHGRKLQVAIPEAPIWIDGDATRLVQVVGNLLQNASKFTPDDGQVAVSLETVDDRAVLQVSDSGVGIDAETLSRIFEPFVQADRTLDRSKGGLGLGLSLVKGLVELHGGTVGAHSDGLGRGACFAVSLPRN